MTSETKRLFMCQSAARFRRGMARVVAGLALTTLCGAQTIAGFLPNPIRTVSTIPPNGDVNPNGVVFVPKDFPGTTLAAGDLLVTDFNNNQNLQGLGTTVLHVPQSGSPSVFYTADSTHTGLSGALGTMHAGFVLVGSFPTYDGTCATAQAGSILILNSAGQLDATIAGELVDGPWGMAVYDEGYKAHAFVTNALNGTVTRFDLAVTKGAIGLTDAVTVASGYRFSCDPASLVDAPAGLVYEPKTDTLYVASTLDDAVYALTGAGSATSSLGTGTVIYQDSTHLHGALQLALTPTGHLLVTNNDVINSNVGEPSEIVEFTTAGQFVKQIPVDPNLGGSFGVQTSNLGNNVSQLAAVDDNAVTLTIWTIPTH